VVDRCVSAARRGPDESLEYVLNDVAFSELRRLERGGSKEQIARYRNLAARLGRMSEVDKQRELKALVRHHAGDIAGNFNPRVYHFARDVLPPAISFLLNPISGLRDGLQVLGAMAEQIRVEGDVDRLRGLCDRGTLVVAPTHSSNLDSVVLGLGLSRSGLPPVTYGAGKNLFSNRFMSFFMHNLGAYRVDRRLRFALYKDVLKEYSTVLLERGYHSLFFPGGTRSRSNEVESKLKLGLLGTALAAFRNNALADGPVGRIFIVPATINYRLVLEAETLIEDHLAEQGQSRYIIEDDEFSRLGRVIEFARKIMAHEGAVVLRFGAPLDPFGNAVSADGQSHDRQGRPVDAISYLRNSAGAVSFDAQREAAYTRVLGSRVAEVFARDSVFLGTHLVARAAYEAAIARTRVGDIYQLLRLSDSALALPAADLARWVDRVREAIEAHPERGSLDAPLRSMHADAIVEQTLAHLSTYHLKPVLYRRGEHVRIGSTKLLYFYQNRTAAIPVEASP
jgi:glycerol-3-phosphate O-acyltransferase